MKLLISILVSVLFACGPFAAQFPFSYLGTTVSGGGGSPVTFSDDFNRTSEFPITGDWTSQIGGWAEVYLLANGALGTNNGSSVADGLMRVKTTTATFPDNQSCTATYRTGSTIYCGPATRVSSSGEGYFAFHTGTAFQVYKTGGTTFGAQVGTDITGSEPTAGDTVTLEASGTSTVTLTVKRNGSTQGSVSDSSSPLASGQPGLYIANGFYIEAMSATSL